MKLDAYESELGELHKQILENAPLSIITIDKKGYITSANKHYKIFSKTGEYRNHNIFERAFFIREGLVDDFRKLLTDGTIIRRDDCYEKNSKGEEKYMKIIAVPLKDENGSIVGALSMAEDNTETVLFKKQLENLNKKLEAKVNQRTVKLKKANEELDRGMKLKSIFMADISHELRTALAIIQGNLELVNMKKISDANDLESYDQIFSEIKRMSAMLSSLVMVSNPDVSSQSLTYEKINLNQLIASIVRSIDVVSKKKNITVKYENAEMPIELMADRDKLEKLLINLISNAIRYNKMNGWINIEAEKTKNEIVIKVEDGGIGIPQEHLVNIFERFYRVDKARTRKEGGFGLGLAICKWVAEVHGGRIDVASKVGKGTLFTVRLPLSNKKQLDKK